MSIFWIIKFKELYSRQVVSGCEGYSIVGKEHKKSKAKKLARRYQRRYNRKETSYERVDYFVVEQTDPENKYIAFIYDYSMGYYGNELWSKKPETGWKKITDKDYENYLTDYTTDYCGFINYKKGNEKDRKWAHIIPLKIDEDSDQEDN